VAGFFTKLFQSRSTEQDIDGIAQQVTLFMHACKMHVEQRDLMVPRKYTLFYVYALGATYAALGDASNTETTAYAVLLQVIPRTSQLESSDISSMIGNCTQARHTEAGEKFFTAGHDDYLSWQSKETDISHSLAKLLLEE
jgi:hypothetical protein